MPESPFIFAKWALRLGAVAFFGVDGLAVEAAAEGAAALAKDLWEKYLSRRTPAERCRDIEALAQAEPSEVIAAVREELQAIPDEAARRAAEAYAAALPGQLRASLRRATDPSGRTVPPALVPQSAEDVLRLLPQRPPRFRAGDRPPGIGDWELVELLGTGGFGEVWKARNPHMNTKVAALKFCLDAKAAASLRREAALLDRVGDVAERRGRIVRILTTALSAEPPCIIYEFVEGGTLAGVIRERQASGQPFRPEEAARFILELAETVGVCHALQPPIVHRDLKPANILVDARTGRLRITDFGIGGIVAQQAVQAGLGGMSVAQHSLASASGSHTPLYASPQQMRGGPSDVRDDVYALGVVWWQMLCGDMGTGAPSGRWMQKLTAAGHPAELVDLLADCLEPQAAQRVASAVMLAERLREVLSSPVSVPPPLPTRAEPVTPQPVTQLLATKRPLTVEGLTQDPFETPEEYAASLVAQGRVEAGRFAFAKQDYDIHQQTYCLPPDIAWAEFMQQQHQPEKGLVLKAGRDLASQAYANGAEQPLYAQLTAAGKTYAVQDFTLLIGGRHHALVDAAREAWLAQLQAKLAVLREIIAAMVPIPNQTYAMCKYPVTQAWYQAVTGTNTSHVQRDLQHPVEQVTWHDAQEFCKLLNESCGDAELHQGRKFVLPTEAQWEFACRAGCTGRFGLLKSGKEGNVNQMAWYEQNSGERTHPVGRKEPNAWGLCDMHGNVWEWCSDAYDASGPKRVLRGGSRFNSAAYCTASYRVGSEPGNSRSNVGFRLASVPA